MPTVDQYRDFFRGYNPSGGGREEWNMWCQAFVARASKFAGRHNRDYDSARDAMRASGGLNGDWRAAPLGAIFYWHWNPDGHVAIHVGDGWLMMGSRHISDAFGGVSLNAGLVHFEEFQRRAGLSFAGWAPTNGGSVVPVEVPQLAANQRRVGDTDARLRPTPDRGQAAVDVLAPRTVHTFDGHKRGERVDDNETWFRHFPSGLFVWSGGVDGGPNTAGLNDLNPVDPALRKVNSLPSPDARVRRTPSTSAEVLTTYVHDAQVRVFGYTTAGDAVDGSRLWFQVGEGWMHASTLNNADIAGLADVTPVVVTPIPDPQPQPEPIPQRPPLLPYVGVTAADFEVAKAWLRVDVVLDQDYTHDSTARATAYYESELGGDWRREVLEWQAHWWGDPEKRPSHDGTVDYLRRTVDLGANDVISSGRVTLMIPDTDSAYTNGAWSMKGVTSEIDPNLDEQGYKTWGFVLFVRESKNPRLLNAAIRRHNEIVNPRTGKPFATSCNRLDVSKARMYANLFHSGALDPATGLPPVVTPDPQPQPDPDEWELRADAAADAYGEVVAAGMKALLRAIG